VEGVVPSLFCWLQAAKLSSIAKVSSSAKIFFIFKIVLSFFGRTVYNNCACLDFWDWGWQRPGVVPAMPGHLLCLSHYNCTEFVIQAPGGDEIFRYLQEKRHTTSPNSVTLSVYRVERINRWHHSSIGKYTAEAPWGDEISQITKRETPHCSPNSVVFLFEGIG
jgi:hypothetical protein